MFMSVIMVQLLNLFSFGFISYYTFNSQHNGIGTAQITINGSQRAKMKKSIPDMSLP